MKNNDIKLVLDINNVKEIWRKGIEDLVPISEGYVVIYKPNIEKTQCYGYYSWDSESVESARKAESDWENNPKYFKEYNLERFDAHYKIEENSGVEFKIKNDGDVKFGIITRYAPNRRLLTDSERKGFALVFEQMRAKFEKRLDTYIKKYGTDNLRAWTFDYYD